MILQSARSLFYWHKRLDALRLRRMLFDDDIESRQQPRESISRELRFFHLVDAWIDPVIDCIPEISLFQVGMLDGGVDQVASKERSTSQVTISEIDRLEAAVTEGCFLDVEFIKRTVIKNAIVEGEREVEELAKVKSYTQHFAASENGLLERSVVCLYQTEIAVDKFAIDEPEMCKIAIGEITI